MILIIDSGSTNAQWTLIKEKQIYGSLVTEGINPSVQTSDFIKNVIRAQLPETFFSQQFSHIYFYGAGCVGEKNKQSVRTLLEGIFSTGITVESDLCAAAKSLFHDKKGIACILGTGSNSGFYDGGKITWSVPSLGYILGDEGSGGVLGKMFLADCLKGIAPAGLAGVFMEKYNIKYPEILEKIYKQSSPNRFLAGFSSFLTDYKNEQYVRDLIKTNFRNFFTRNVLQYDYRNYPIGFVGSVAFYYDEILRETASEYGIDIRKIVKSPMDDLVRYHMIYE